MNVGKFYKVVRTMTTVAEALDESRSSNQVTSIVILPPTAGDMNVDSDTEDLPESLDTDEIFETAREVELEKDVTSASDEDVSEGEDEPRAKKGKQARSKWRKDDVLKNALTEEEMVKLRDSFPLLINTSPFKIWQTLFDTGIVENIVQQTELYAHRKKNSPDFKTSSEELLN